MCVYVCGGGQVGVVGFCMGGALGFLAAQGGSFDAAVGFYGAIPPPLREVRGTPPVVPCAQLLSTPSQLNRLLLAPPQPWWLDLAAGGQDQGALPGPQWHRVLLQGLC